jgi:glutathione S-transferase
MLKLYYHTGACSLAAHIVLVWTGEPYEISSVQFGDPEYLKINPAGAVPALDTGEGWILTQDAAILRYLARRFPKADLAGGESLRDQAEIDRWASFITGDLHPAFFPLFSPQRYTTSKDDAAHSAVRAAASEIVKKRLALVERHLTGRELFLGSKRSIIDAYIFPMENWAEKMLPEGLSPYPAIKAHHQRVGADAGVKRALQEEGA